MTPRRLVLSFFGFGALTVAGHGRHEAFIYTGWLLDYSVGFLPRGLPGAVLSLFVEEKGLLAVAIAAGVVVAAAILAVSIMLTRLVFDGERMRLNRLILSVALVGSAAGFPFIAAEYGRFDSIGVILAVLAGWALASDRAWSPWLAGVLGAIAALTHPAPPVIFWPWLAVFAYRRSRTWVPVIAIPAIVAVALTQIEPAIPRPELAAYLTSRTSLRVEEAALAPLYTGFRETWAYFVDIMSVWRVGLRLPLSALASAPLAAFAIWTIRPQIRRLYPEMVASIIPLALSIIAVDFGRWFAFSGCLLMVTAIIKVRDKPIRALVIGAALVLLASVATGPIGFSGFRYQLGRGFLWEDFMGG